MELLCCAVLDVGLFAAVAVAAVAAVGVVVVECAVWIVLVSYLSDKVAEFAAGEIT